MPNLDFGNKLEIAKERLINAIPDRCRECPEALRRVGGVAICQVNLGENANLPQARRDLAAEFKKYCPIGLTDIENPVPTGLEVRCNFGHTNLAVAE